MSSQKVIDTAIQAFEKALKHLHDEFAKLQVGRASPSILESVMVEAYGSKQPLKSVASTTVLDAQTLQVQAWDKSILAAVEKGVRMAELNLNPVNDGTVLRIVIPPLTQERRQELAKILHRLSEEARISIRGARQDAINKVRDMQKSKEINEDDQHSAEKKLQDKVDHYNTKIQELSVHKEADIMKV